jgi:hypothetical protein
MSARRRNLLAVLLGGALALPITGIFGGMARSSLADTRTPIASAMAAAERDMASDLAGITASVSVSALVPRHSESPVPLGGALDLALLVGITAVAVAYWWKVRHDRYRPTSYGVASPLMRTAQRTLVEPWHTATWRAMHWWTTSLPGQASSGGAPTSLYRGWRSRDSASMSKAREPEPISKL